MDRKNKQDPAEKDQNPERILREQNEIVVGRNSWRVLSATQRLEGSLKMKPFVSTLVIYMEWDGVQYQYVE